MIYTDSLVFTFATAILEHGLGLNSNIGVCGAAILLCLACYLSTKLLIYYFLVEKVVRTDGNLTIFNCSMANNCKYIIRAVSTSRLKSKLWCFNVFGLLRVFCVLFSNRMLTTSSALLRHRSPQLRLSCSILQSRRDLHHRHRSQICDATHHLRRSPKLLPHPPLRHPTPEALLLQELPELRPPHYHTPLLRRLPRNTHLVGRQPDSAYGTPWGSSMDLPDVL